MPNFLSVDQTFAFLLLHDPEDVKEFDFDLPLHSLHALHTFQTAAGVKGDATVQDASSTVTIKTPNDDLLKQVITVKIPSVKREFQSTPPYKYLKGRYPLKDVENEKGTLYYRGDTPAVGDTFFNAQQYPSYDVKTTDRGRIVIEFWAKESDSDKYYIAGVFKTDVDNNVSGGIGKWKETASQ